MHLEDMKWLNPQDKCVTILKFVQNNHQINTLLNEDIQYVVKMISTGQLNDIDKLNRQFTEQLAGKSRESGNIDGGMLWAEAITGSAKTQKSNSIKLGAMR